MSVADSTVSYRELPEFPGYRVGTDGSVWTKWLSIGKGWRYGFERVLGEWRQLKAKKNPNGRLFVCLYPGRKWRLIHHLVLEAFVGPRPTGFQCCHNDGDPTNNHLENLRWDTAKNNMKDRDRHGRTRRGEMHCDAKLTETQVREIRRAHTPHKKKGPGTPAMLAKQHGVNVGTIQAIVYRRTWKHILQ